MRHSQLSNEQILLALSESYNIIAAITKYQLFLASAIGLPKDDTGRTEIMAASTAVLEKIRAEIRALEHELDRRETQEKRRL
jgi:predicted HAD superfamily phosphohydrolase